MSRSWRDYRAATPPPDGCDDSDNRDISSGFEPEPVAFVTNVANVTGLPADVVAGLERLKDSPAPRLLHPERWPAVVADALRLASEGWAASALRLGWSPLDLYGAVPDKHGDPEADGLATKLAGRRIVALCASFATVRDARSTTFIHRGNNAGAKLMWDLVR